MGNREQLLTLLLMARTNDEVHVAVIDRTGAISGTPGSVLEKFEYLSVAKGATTSDNSPNYISDVLNGQSQYIWNGYFGDDSAFGSSYSNVGATWGTATNVASPVEYWGRRWNCSS